MPVVEAGKSGKTSQSQTAYYVQPWEVATMMRRAGFPATEIVKGVAIVGAESSYQINPPGNPNHLGLFQIADTKGFDNNKLKTDPQYNVNAAYQVWKAQGWAHGWTDYEHGSWTKFLGSAAAAVATSRKNVPDSKLPKWNVHSDDVSAVHEAAGAVGAGGAYTAATGGVAAVGDALAVLTRLDTWIRAGEVVGGAVALIAGLVLLARLQS